MLWRMSWWRNLRGAIRRNRANQSEAPIPQREPLSDPGTEEWNRLVDQGWLQEWKPRRGRGHSLWVRRAGEELQVFPRASVLRHPHYRLNGNVAYRSFGHPEGPSSIPWFVVRGRTVYPGEGYPGGATDRPLYRIEHLRKRDIGVTIRRVRPDDHLNGR